MKEIPEDYIYLDYAATAPLCEEARREMLEQLVSGREGIRHGTNPNALSSPGRYAFELIESARKNIAQCLHARRPDEIIFTSGATEADNAALFGLMAALQEERRLKGKPCVRPHFITTEIEHDAILSAAHAMESSGIAVTYLRPSRDGLITARSLENALTEDTLLVSIQMANSEIGSIQQVGQLASLAHEKGALFHTDATQALGKIQIDLSKIGVDAASFSSHKIGGPKGVGALYLQVRTPFKAQMLGGGQEAGKRSGTQNVCGIVGFAAACKAVTSIVEDEQHRLGALRDKLYADLATFDAIQPTVDVPPGGLDHLPNIVNVLVEGIESQTLVLRFDSLGFAVSGGSACASHSLDPSHVLTSLGIPGDEAQCALRISLGRYTTDEDINRFLLAVPQVLKWR